MRIVSTVVSSQLYCCDAAMVCLSRSVNDEHMPKWSVSSSFRLPSLSPYLYPSSPVISALGLQSRPMADGSRLALRPPESAVGPLFEASKPMVPSAPLRFSRCMSITPPSPVVPFCTPGLSTICTSSTSTALMLVKSERTSPSRLSLSSLSWNPSSMLS